jgi:hypothetical protein
MCFRRRSKGFLWQFRSGQQLPDRGDREHNLDRLAVKVELYSKMFHGDLKELNNLKKKITDLLKSTIIITPKVELLEPGSLPPSMGKAVRVYRQPQDLRRMLCPISICICGE